MFSINHTEDAFLCFYNHVYSDILSIDARDHSAINNFYKIINNNEPLTENQAKFIVRLLKKYRNQWKDLTNGIEAVVDQPRWRNEFRKINLTKEVFVEVDHNVPWICLRFPYFLKESFSKEILKDSESFFYKFIDENYWDKERKLRKLNLYKYNILQIYDYVCKHGFEIHESFIEAVNLVEEIWNREDKISKTSKIIDGKVELLNADENSTNYFESNRLNFTNDLLLSKSMGFVLDDTPRTLIEKIATTEETWFWHNNLKELLDFLCKLDGKIVFILDRSSDYENWIKIFKENLLASTNDCGVRVCFRLNKNENPEFNTWIKNNGMGGKVDEGKFLIFLQKPNKWLFDRTNDVKVVITNSIYPPNDQIAMYFLQSHPCVIFAGDVKPTDPKGKKIVSL